MDDVTGQPPPQLPIRPMPLLVQGRVLTDDQGTPWGVLVLDSGVASFTVMAQPADLLQLAEQIKKVAGDVRKAAIVVRPSPLDLRALREMNSGKE